ncbi:hypothetical protein [Sinorhizobium meliloti]|uniref:hypothetical protein n=1 Tax=Rhizobium meliloti TaxID=382 RepID=UPI001F30B5FE|nr:hypothetical protein [Sinorhizobium meliloti]
MTKRARRRGPMPLWFMRGALAAIKELSGDFRNDKAWILREGLHHELCRRGDWPCGIHNRLRPIPFVASEPRQRAKWFDEQRLAVDPIIAPIAIDNSNGAGADIPAPVK